MEDYGWKNRLYLYSNQIFTILSCILVCFRGKLDLDLKKLNQFMGKNETLISSQKYKTIFLEWGILCIHPYSFLVGKKRFIFHEELHTNIYYHYNDILSLMSIIKNIYILGMFLHFSVWRSSRAKRIW